MKIAAFCTMWNEEVMMYYYQGMSEWAKSTGGIVDLFACYGKTDMQNPHNIGEFSIYNYPDLTEYDGVIIIASNINSEEARSKLIHRVKMAGIPCVVADYQIDGFGRIYIDQGEYIQQLVHHMAEVHGAKTFAYISGLATNVESEFRKKGFLKGMEECGISVREDLIFEKEFYYNDGLDVARDLLDRKEPLPDAIICANDDMAAGVCEALLEAGVAVGEECRVSGFDQYYLGENFAPTLTTIRRPRASLAYHACQMLENYNGPVDQKEPATMFIGQTCGCNHGVHKNDVKFRRNVFYSSNMGEGFHTMLDSVEEDMIQGSGVEAIMHHFDDFFANRRSGFCRILINPNVEDYTKEAKSFNSYRLCVRDYLTWHAGEATSEMEDQAGHAYMYAPIHFQEHMYGVLIFRDIEEFLGNRELHNFTKSLGFSLENMVQRRKVAYVNDKLEMLYETDYLTGCYNRHGYAKLAESMRQTARERGVEFQTIFIDIDGLKTINDVYGHEAGDVVIRAVGRTLLELSGEDSKVFRHGGDEFILLHIGKKEFEPLVRRFDEAIERKNKELATPYQISASMGIFHLQPDDHRSLEECVKEADAAMYEVKKKHHARQKKKK